MRRIALVEEYRDTPGFGRHLMQRLDELA